MSVVVKYTKTKTLQRQALKSEFFHEYATLSTVKNLFFRGKE